VPTLALPHARWCKRIAGERVAVAAAVYWKVGRACRLERQRRYFDTATKGRRSENKKVGVEWRIPPWRERSGEETDARADADSAAVTSNLLQESRRFCERRFFCARVRDCRAAPHRVTSPT